MTIEQAAKVLAEALRVRATFPTADVLASQAGCTRQALYNRAVAINKDLQKKKGAAETTPLGTNQPNESGGRHLTAETVPDSPTTPATGEGE